LNHQRSGGLGHDVRVVGVHGVQSPLKAELAQPTEQGVGAPLWHRRSRLQDPKDDMIYSSSLSICFSYKLVYNIVFYVAEEKFWARSPLLGRLAACT
jgi:hypothetical protein